MPTLTPKADKKKMKAYNNDNNNNNSGGGLYNRLPNTTIDLDDSNNNDNSPDNDNNNGKDTTNTSTNSNNNNRLEYLDSLRGILSVMVVYHHFRCGFRPCHMFNYSVEWIKDISICEDYNKIGTTTTNIILNPFFNGTFAVAVFLTMSGFVLSHNLWKSNSTEKWRLAIAKRFIRLAIPCGAALIYAYILGGFKPYKQAADITKSLWLEQLHSERPSPITGLINQIIFGLWHGTTTLNNAIWTMQYELIGSYITFVLIQFLKGSAHKIRTRWLTALFIIMILPSITRSRGNLDTRIHYKAIEYIKGQPGQKQSTKSIERIVSVNPTKHSYILHKLHEQVNIGNSKVSSDLSMSYKQIEPDPWYLKRNVIDKDIIVLDKPKALHNISNVQIYHEIIDAADPSNKKFSKPEIEVLKITSWKTVNPWIWYSPFIAGLWISERILTKGSKQGISFFGILISNTPLVHIMLLISYICASYPYTSIEASSFIHWKIMSNFASIFGISNDSIQPFYCIIGSFTLLYYIIGHNNPLIRKLLVIHPILPMLGKISFSLYLTHIPILYTFTSWIFIHLYPFFDDNLNSSSWIALLISLPIIFIIAYIFYIYVDQPAIELSRIYGYRLLGITDTHPQRGYSNTNTKQYNTGATNENETSNNKQQQQQKDQEEVEC